MKRAVTAETTAKNGTTIPVVTLNSAGVVCTVNMPCGILSGEALSARLKQESVADYRRLLRGDTDSAVLHLAMPGSFSVASAMAFGEGEKRTIYLQLISPDCFVSQTTEETATHIQNNAMSQITVLETIAGQLKTKLPDDDILCRILDDGCYSVRRYFGVLNIYHALVKKEHLSSEPESVDIGVFLREYAEKLRENCLTKQFRLIPAVPVTGKYLCCTYAEDLRMYLIPLLHRLITESDRMLTVTVTEGETDISLKMECDTYCDFESSKQLQPEWEEYFALRYEVAKLCEQCNDWIVRRESRDGHYILTLLLPKNNADGQLCSGVAQGKPFNADYRRLALLDDIEFYLKRGICQ